MSKNIYSYPVKKWLWASKTASYYHTPKRHMQFAIDFGVEVGTSVFAMAAGMVSGTGTDKDGYVWVELTHLNREYTQYGHLDKILVEKKQQVRRGQMIALSGATGDLAGLGPHLHVECDVGSDRHWTNLPITWARLQTSTAWPT